MTGIAQRMADAPARLLIDGRATPMRIRVCNTFAARLVGWGTGPDRSRPRTTAAGICGVWLQPCPAIHTLWLRHAVDVAFIDGRGRVRRVCAAVRPGRIRSCLAARAALELPAGWLAAWGVEPGVHVALARDD